MASRRVLLVLYPILQASSFAFRNFINRKFSTFQPMVDVFTTLIPYALPATRILAPVSGCEPSFRADNHSILYHLKKGPKFSKNCSRSLSFPCIYIYVPAGSSVGDPALDDYLRLRNAGYSLRDPAGTGEAPFIPISSEK